MHLPLPWLLELASRIFMNILQQNNFENLTIFLYFEPKICFSKFKQICCVMKIKKQMVCLYLWVKANVIDKICVINDQLPCQKLLLTAMMMKISLMPSSWKKSPSLESKATMRTWWIIWGIESSLMYVQGQGRQFSGLLAYWSCQGFYWSIVPT